MSNDPTAPGDPTVRGEPAQGHPTSEAPDFGPSGYLPQRAAKRARKIVLRAPMGMHWIWGAIAVGVGVLVVGIVFLTTAGGPPGAPFVELGPLTTIQDGYDGQAEYRSTSTGRLRIFHVEGLLLTWCEESRQFEGPDGVWTATGRGRGGVASLPEHPTVIVDGIAYWDPSTTLAGPIADPTPAARACGFGVTD